MFCGKTYHGLKSYALVLGVVPLFTAMSALHAQDQTLTEGKPSDVGVDSEILKSGLEQYKTAIEEDRLRSAVLLVARHGTIVFHESVGWKDKAERIPLERTALFRMASNTKPLIATGIAILRDDEKIRFHDKVGMYIAAFQQGRSNEITLHHLLTHTSGFRIKPIFFQPLVERSEENPDAPSLRVEVNRFALEGPEIDPGTTYSYSNAGYNSLGAVIEAVSGQALEEFLHDRIYKPLGMSDSYHHELRDKLDGKIGRMSTVYYKREGRWTVGWKPGSAPQYPFVRASGGMISTARDYAVFCQMMLNGGIYDGVRVLSETTVQQLITPHTKSLTEDKESANRTSFYGYGWRITSQGVFAHSGSDGTAAWVDPKSKLIVLVFTQSRGEPAMHSMFFNRIRASLQ